MLWTKAVVVYLPLPIFLIVPCNFVFTPTSSIPQQHIWIWFPFRCRTTHNIVYIALLLLWFIQVLFFHFTLVLYLTIVFQLRNDNIHVAVTNKQFKFNIFNDICHVLKIKLRLFFGLRYYYPKPQIDKLTTPIYVISKVHLTQVCCAYRHFQYLTRVVVYHFRIVTLML